MNDHPPISGYRYNDNGALNASHSYLLPSVITELDRYAARLTPEARRVFDLGCGNGSVAATVAMRGWKVTGVDPSIDGIAEAKMAYPNLALYAGSAYSHLSVVYGRYPVVISLEVIEHVYAPRAYGRTLFDLVEPGGIAIISTPYHGYVKNLALALTGRLDAHFTALWDHGHIKFWSVHTLKTLLNEIGFTHIRIRYVGRIRQLAKSMIAIAEKP